MRAAIDATNENKSRGLNLVCLVADLQLTRPGALVMLETRFGSRVQTRGSATAICIQVWKYLIQLSVLFSRMLAPFKLQVVGTEM